MFTSALLAFVLAADPKPRLDADGIPLPAEALRRFGSAKFCTEPPKSVAFSADGKTVFLVRADARAWPDEAIPAASAWELATGRRLWEFLSDGLRGDQVSVDPNGKTVWLVGHVNRGGKPPKTSFVRLKLDPTTGKELNRETLHPGRSQAFDLRPDGTLAWSCLDEQRSDLSLPITKADGSVPSRWDPNGHFIERVRFSPDGKVVFFAGPAFSGDGWKLAAREVNTGKPLWEKECPPIDTLAVSPDGKTVVIAVAKPAPRQGPKAPATPAGTVVLGLKAADGTNLGSLDLGGRSHTLFRSNHLHSGRPLSFTPDGKTVLVMTDDRKVLPVGVKTWKAGEVRTDGEVFGWSTPDGKVYLNPTGRNLTIHDAKTHRPLAQSPPPLDRPNISFPRLTFTTDGMHLTRWGEVWVEWAVTTGRETERVPLEKALEGGMVTRVGNRFGPNKPVTTPDGKRLLRPVPSTDSKTTGFEVIDTASDKTVAELNDVPSTMRLAFTPDSKRLVAGSSIQGVLLWDLTAGGKPALATPDGKGGGSLDALRVHPNSQQAALLEATDNPVNPTKWKIGRYDLAPLKRAKSWTSEGYVTAFEYSAGGRIVGITERQRFAPDGPGDLFVIDPDADAVTVFPLIIHGVALAISPDGRAAAVGTKSGDIHLYEVFSGKRRHTFTGLKRPALSLAFSPDGKTLASESADGPVILWDVKGDLTLPAKPDAAGWEAAWKQLTGDDAEKAFDAVRLFAGYAEGVDELRKRFAEVKSPSAVLCERAVEAVRLADTDAGRKLLAEWAKGPPDSPLTAAAKR